MQIPNLDRWAQSLRDDVAPIEVPHDLDDRFSRYRDDPVGFVKDILAAESATRPTSKERGSRTSSIPTPGIVLPSSNSPSTPTRSSHRPATQAGTRPSHLR